MFGKKAKTTKKIVLRLECTVCKTKAQLAIKRCKHFELVYGAFPLLIFCSSCAWLEIGKLTVPQR